ncbi:MAG: hypothetical protein EZS28_033525, partial [Streblomastix strix]
MMHSINGSAKVQIADFGMTIITGEGEVGLVKNKNILYVAPELVIDTQIGTNKMDMWSIGVVLYQLATHEFPINANGLLDLQNKMRSRRIDRPASIKDDLQWDLLIKLLEFDPNKRFSAAEALQHPYFTSPQVDLEISIEARRIASNAAASIEEGQNKVTLYDLDSAFIVATTEISKFLSVDPEAEERQILSTRNVAKFSAPRKFEQDQIQMSSARKIDQDQIQMSSARRNELDFKSKQEEEDRKAAIKLHEEEKQRIVLTEKQLYQEGKVLCPFCDANQPAKEIHHHIRQQHPKSLDMYNDMTIIAHVVIQQTVVQQGKNVINQGVLVACPFCKSQIDISELKDHVIKMHSQQHIEVYLLLLHNIKLTIQLFEISELDEQRRHELEHRRITEEEKINKKEEDKKLIEQEKQLFKEGRINCPFCDTIKMATEISEHIMTAHPERKQIYKDMWTITQVIVSQTIKQQGRTLVIQGKDIQCPFCQAFLDDS